jgi:hypothetical protein
MFVAYSLLRKRVPYQVALQESTNSYNFAATLWFSKVYNLKFSYPWKPLSNTQRQFSKNRISAATYLPIHFLETPTCHTYIGLNCCFLEAEYLFYLIVYIWPRSTIMLVFSWYYLFKFFFSVHEVVMVDGWRLSERRECNVIVKSSGKQRKN